MTDRRDGSRDAASKSGSKNAPESASESALPAEAPLTFPDLPRLELDQLLGQLVERAQEVLGTQSRLRGLLRANQVVTGDLALPAVLRRIVEAARDLVGARYAALGVIAPAGGLAEFVHVGMPRSAVEAIGHVPHGKGLLGALIDDPRPIRLRRIGDDARSAGFPSGHPAMDSFLGVPIRVGDEVFGNLYLAESLRGEFTADDEELAAALASTAAAAIDRARLYTAARVRGEWLAATAAVTRQLLTLDPVEAVDPSGPLQLIAERVREIADADLATVVLPAEHGDLRVQVAVGAGADDLPGLHVPVAGSLSGRVFTTDEPVRISQPGDIPGLRSVASGRVDVGPVLVLPLRGPRHMHGVLTAARLRGRSAFSDEDLEMAGSFADQAVVAIELAEARAEQQRAEMLAERERIAADLHDHVIQRLFAAGLSLQATAATLDTGPARERVLATIGDIDTTIGQIRTSIFRLQQTTQAAEQGVRGRLDGVVAQVAPVLGFEPAVRFSGLMDAVPDDVADDLVAVVREALSNVARHAHARSADVDLAVTPDRITLTVCDDGVGLGSTTRRSGLANLRRRAEHRGGTLTLSPGDPAGTRLSWSIPRRPAASVGGRSGRR